MCVIRIFKQYITSHHISLSRSKANMQTRSILQRKCYLVFFPKKICPSLNASLNWKGVKSIITFFVQRYYGCPKMLTYTQRCNGNCGIVWVSKCQTEQNDIFSSSKDDHIWSDVRDKIVHGIYRCKYSPL